MSQLKDCDHVTLIFDEMVGIRNRCGLPLTAIIVKDGVVKDLFLDLLQLRRCEAVFIFEKKRNFLENENINIKVHVFLGWMDVQRCQQLKEF